MTPVMLEPSAPRSRVKLSDSSGGAEPEMRGF